MRHVRTCTLCASSGRTDVRPPRAAQVLSSLAFLHSLGLIH